MPTFNIRLSDQDAERITEALNMLRNDRLDREQERAAEKLRELSLRIIDAYMDTVGATI